MNTCVVRVPIASNHAKRPKAPVDVWDWQDHSTWRETVWELIGDIADEAVKQAFLKSPPEYVVGDNLSWLDETVLSVQGHFVDSKNLLAQRVSQRFRAFRAVHGTRTADLASFYNEGLLPLKPDVVNEQARSIFLSDEFPELNTEKLEDAIRRVGTDLREGRVYFDGNEKLLVEYCGHYMLYGSEYLIGIAAHLDGWRDYRQVLKRFGQPVVFVCDVPLTLMKESTIAEFSGAALAMNFQELLDGENYSRDHWEGAGLCINQTLPPECIVGHYHPTIRRDPLACHR